MNSIHGKMSQENVLKRPPEARDVVLTLEYFYNLKKKFKINNYNNSNSNNNNKG